MKWEGPGIFFFFWEFYYYLLSVTSIPCCFLFPWLCASGLVSCMGWVKGRWSYFFFFFYGQVVRLSFFYFFLHICIWMRGRAVFFDRKYNGPFLWVFYEDAQVMYFNHATIVDLWAEFYQLYRNCWNRYNMHTRYYNSHSGNYEICVRGEIQ